MKFTNFLKGFAVAATAMLSVVACTELNEEQATPDTLSVEPNASIAFKATGNEDVVLNIKTNVKEWNFTAPEWIEGVKDEETLTLNAKDNTAAKSRLGRVEITAGTAKMVKIIVKQAAGSEGAGGDETVTGPEARIVAATDVFYGFNNEGKAIMKVKMTVETEAESDMVAELVLDPEYLEEYKYHTGRNCQLLPAESIDLGDALLTIPAGQKESNELTVTCSEIEGMEFGVGQLVPLMAKPVKNISFPKDAIRANFYIVKKNTKQIRNVLYYEVNDTNPLNTLEYNLEDGTPFFDAVILFAANIRWDSQNDVVYLHNNPNVQALLNESDVYIQPLREKGIKVYLGLLGDHTAAGLCNLSDWGAEQWAQEVAMACQEYKLDGVNLDDEYAGSPVKNKWFTKTSQEAGSRLCYELKKALAAECDWPTEVSYFAWGSLWGCNAVADQQDEVLHQPSDFIDFYVGNYGTNTSPYGGLTLQNCSAMSIELNLGIGGIDEESARRWKEEGYGWVMWFAFDPAPGSNIYNGTGSTHLFERAARGMYDMELLPPKGYYKKIGGGKYDPTFYPFE